MRNKLKFFKEFWKERRVVGAISPSSIFLAKKMISSIDFKSAKILVEFGPGTGIFTKEILKKMRKDATLLVFETQKTFCDQIEAEIKDERMVLINDSAEKIGEYLQKNGCDLADHIISSLPFTVIPTQIKNSILTQSVKFLSDKGSFLQFQYSLNAHKLLKSKFKYVKLDFTPMNIPPAFIYRCQN